MRLSPQTRLDFAKVATITVAYILFSLFLAIYDHVMLGPPLVDERPVGYDLQLNLLIHGLSGLIAGVLGGYLFVVVDRHVFRKNSLGIALLKTAGAYLFVYLVVTVAISLTIGFASRDLYGSSGEIAALVWENATHPAQLVFFVMWGAIALLTLFLLQVYDKFGPGILRKFLMGKYFHPHREERIFMFLDMRSSTTIAEKIGSEAYFRLLRECFSLVTNPILESNGEIANYVGDEIVISWTPSKGFADANCLRCFVAIQKAIAESAEQFRQNFGLVPEFKAGLHFGFVVAGEIGEIKKDIVYSGDVLNAASRIQDLCNTYGENLLASGQTLERMPDPAAFSYRAIGEIELRGKQEHLMVHAVRSNPAAQESI